MGKYTDELITMAQDISEKPPKREMDMLFTIGEQMSVALMSMAMDSLGVPAVSLNAFQVAMHTTSVHGNARLKRIDTERIRRELDSRKIVVVTGFQGIDKYDDYTIWEEEALIPRQLPLRQLCMQMPVRYIQTWTEFIQLIPVSAVSKKAERNHL